MKRLARLLPLVLVGATGCATPSLEQRREASAPAVTALQKGSFDDAEREAQARLSADSGDPYARVVRAIVRYKKTGHQLALDLRTAAAGAFAAGGVNQKYMRQTLEQAEGELSTVEDDLAAAARSPDVSMELCLACWKIDWNGNGRVDRRDELLMQIEVDAEGQPIPEDDPRRKPTFRFDRGDIAWARAFVAFQRGAIDLVLAYDWAALNEVASARRDRDLPDTLTLRLVQPDRVSAAKQRFLDGLAQSEESRRAYLAETDDDREWVPNPRQKSHPMPLPVDQALYDTWGGVVGDLERLIRGEEGLSLAEVVTLIDEREDRAKAGPKGFLDIGRMLSHPGNIVIHVRDIERLDRGRDVDKALSSVLGDNYVARMKPSPLPTRLARMKGEIDRREEPLERKLRYLFWIN